MDTPTSRIIAAALAPIAICDLRGRQLSLRRVSALDRLRLFKALGPDLSQNAPYLGIALLAVAITAIDDVPVPPPVTEGQLEALVHRLGDDGLSAIANAMVAEPSEDEEQMAAGN
jgi:hypothetical protein